MTLKSVSALMLCSALALSASNFEAAAHHKKHHGKTARAIAGIVALGMLGAAVGHHQRKNEYYDPHPALHPDENAVGTCMHHAKRLVREAGGHHARLNRVNRVEAKPNGRTVVVFHATGFYDFGAKKSKVRCVVKHHRIVKFKFN